MIFLVYSLLRKRKSDALQLDKRKSDALQLDERDRWFRYQLKL